MPTKPAWVINISIGYPPSYALDFTETHQAYAERIGAKFVKVTSLSDGETDPMWMKYHALRAYLKESRAVMVIDTDAEILPACPAFDGVCQAWPGMDLFAALGRSHRPNAGMMLYRGGKRTIVNEFIDALFAARDRQLPPQDVVVPGDDNGPVIHLLRQKRFRDRLHILGPVWNNTVCPTDWDFIRHYTGPMREYAPSGKS